MSFGDATSITSATHSHPWGWLDRLGMGLAFICAVHCLLTPILVVFIPLVATTFWVNHDFHLWMVGIVAPLTIFSMFLGCRKHHDRLLISLGVSGLLLLVCGILSGLSHDCAVHGQYHSILPHQLENWLTTLGGFLLICAHFRNYRLCRSSSCTHD